MSEDRERRRKRVHRKYDDSDVSYYLIGNRDVEEEKEYEKEYLQYLRDKIMSLEIPTHFKRVRHVGMGYVEDDKKGLARQKSGAFANKVQNQQDDNDDEHYQNMINELFERMREKFSLEDNLAFKDEVKKSKKSTRHMKTEKKQEPILGNQVIQRLKQFINEINGEEVKLVIQKKLYASDLHKNQNRLNMPRNQVESDDFLTKEEKEYVESGNGLNVRLLGPRLQFHNHHEQPMVLTIWNVGKNRNYVLKTNWYNFVVANREDLKENAVIQVWSFRLEGELCFAIACLN